MGGSGGVDGARVGVDVVVANCCSDGFALGAGTCDVGFFFLGFRDTDRGLNRNVLLDVVVPVVFDRSCVEDCALEMISGIASEFP